MKRTRCFLLTERGVSVTAGALILAGVLIVGALAFDLAVHLARVSHAEWEAEGMAMAAATALRDTGNMEDALRAGKDWAYRNDVDFSLAECCSFGDLRPAGAPDGVIDTVTAASRARHSTFFLQYLGLPEAVSVRRTATAQVVGAARSAVCPWGVVGDPTDVAAQDGSYLGLVPGRVYALDPSVSPQGTGDLLPLDLSGRGAAGYEEALAHGCREEEVGTVATRGLATFLPSTPEMAASTEQALSHRYVFEAADGFADYLSLEWCDVSFEFDQQGHGVGHATGYSPYDQLPRSECVKGTLDGGAGRLVIVPIVSRPPGDPGGAVRVLGLASMYVLSWDRGDASSVGRGTVYGMFLDRATVRSTGLEGEDDNPFAPLRVVLVD